MDAANSRGGSSPGASSLHSWRHIVAGLQAGVLGALAMLGYLMLGAILHRRSVWTAPNLFATVFAGADAYTNHYVRTSLAGASLIIVIYGFLGAIWGAAVKNLGGWRTVALGALSGVAVYSLFFGLIWPHTRPLLALYAPSGQLEAAHFLWGVMLARSARYARRLGGRTEEFHSPDQSQDTAPEIRSGEVML